MLDEVLFMQSRLFRMFRERTALPSAQCNEMFHRGGAWEFISSCYDSLHLAGDEAAYNDLLLCLKARGVEW